jgi:uncharacterized membrane protein
LARAGRGLEPNLAGVLCYLVGWISGLFFLALGKDGFVRFHALQSIVTFGALTVAFALILVPVIGWLLSYIVFLIAFILWIILMVKAAQGKRFKLPLAGSFAERHA